MIKKLLSGVSVFALVMVLASSAFAGDTLTATQTVDNGVATVTINYTGDLTALGIQVSLADGMTLASVDAANAPDIKPKAGATGNIDFAYVTPPASPVTFSYTVAGAGAASTQVLYRRLGDEIVVPVN